MAFDSDITYLFTASSDGEAKSWMPEIGDELKTFDGGKKAVACVIPKGELCKRNKLDCLQNVISLKNNWIMLCFQNRSNVSLKCYVVVRCIVIIVQ